jgi:hypothetical protein
VPCVCGALTAEPRAVLSYDVWMRAEVFWYGGASILLGGRVDAANRQAYVSRLGSRVGAANRHFHR